MNAVTVDTQHPHILNVDTTLSSVSSTKTALFTKSGHLKMNGEQEFRKVRHIEFRIVDSVKVRML